MHDVIIAVGFFLFVFIVSLIIFLIIKWRLLKKNQGFTFIGVSYLISKFNLNKSKVNLKKMINQLAVINSFIIAFVSTLISMIPMKLFWQLGIGFILLLILIYALYEIYGRRLHKKWGNKK